MIYLQSQNTEHKQNKESTVNTFISWNSYEIIECQIIRFSGNQDQEHNSRIVDLSKLQT